MVDWYILPKIDQICFHCPIPRRCNENNPRCPRRLALAAGNVSQRKPVLREIQVLTYLKKHPDTSFRAKDLADAIGATYQTTLNLLQRLKTKDKVSHIGRRRTARWKTKCTSARPSQ